MTWKPRIRKAFSLLGVFVLILSLSGLPGCAWNKKWVKVEQTTHLDADLMALKQGDEAFQRGQLDKAV